MSCCPFLLPLLAVPVPQDTLFQRPPWVVHGDDYGASDFGVGARAAGDVNGDGYPDVLVGGQSDLQGEGSVYVFHGSPSGPSAVADWIVNGDQLLAYFGNSASGAGDVNGDGYDDVVVGQFQWDGAASNCGRALLFLGSSAGLSTTPAWTVEGDQTSQLLGDNVVGAGDVNGDGYADVAISAFAWDADHGASSQEGKVWVYLGSPAGLPAVADWSMEGFAHESFGVSLAPAGDVNGDGLDDLIIGSGTAAGGASLVRGSATTGLEFGRAWFASPGAYQQEGRSVAGAGDVNGDGYADVIVGAPFHGGGSGAVLGYWGGPSGPSLQPDWVALAPVPGRFFGFSLDAAGDVNGDGYSDVLVGMIFAENPETNEGAAFVFLGGPSGPATAPDWGFEADAAQSRLGHTVGAAGDLDGDGFGDVVLGANTYGPGFRGAAFVFFGGARALADAPALALEADELGAGLGSAVVWIGDVDGDGHADAAVAAPGHASDTGRVQVHLGQPGGLAATASWTAVGSHAGERFGEALGGGDVDGDGYVDLLVGAPEHDGGGGAVGRVVLFRGSASGLGASSASVAVGDRAGARFGAALALLDADGDGLRDVVAGAPEHDELAAAQGRAFLFLGDPAASLAAPAWTADGPAAGARFGAALAAGDVNGDGFEDLAVGAPDASSGELGEGLTFVFHGGPQGLDLAPSWTGEADLPDAALGSALAGGGDANGDGFADLAVGAPGYDVGIERVGRALVYLGSAAGLSTTAVATLDGAEDGGAFGAALAWGDVDADGSSDLAVGAPMEDGAALDEGRVHLFRGEAAGLQASAVRVLERGVAAAGLGASLALGGDGSGEGFADLLAGLPDLDGGELGEGGFELWLGGGGAGVPRAARQRRLDGAAPIARGGATTAGFAARLLVPAHSAAGRDELRLQVELKPAGTPFDGTGLITTPAFDSGPATAPLELDELVPLAPGDALHWRARFTSVDDRFPHGPWFTLPGRAATETILRAPGGVGGKGRAVHVGPLGSATRRP